MMPTRKLTDSLCRSLQCPEGQRQDDTWDTQTTGLGLRTTDRGTKTWSYRYRWQGKRRRITRGQYGPEVGQLTLSDARNAARRLAATLAAGDDPGAAHDAAKRRRTEKDPNTVQAACERRIERLKAKGRRESYLHDMELRFRKHVYPQIGDMPLADVRPHHIEDMLAPLWDQQAAASYNRVLTMLSPVFAKAVRDNPCAKLDRLTERPKEAFFSVDELAAIWRALDNRETHGHPITASAIRFAMLTLKRSGECAGALAEEFEFEQGLWRLPASRMKGKRPELVPLSDPANAMVRGALTSPLRHAEDPGAILFPSPSRYNTPIRQHALSRVFTQAKRVVGLGDHEGTLHSVRASGVTALRMKGVSSAVVSSLLGHAPVGVTARHYDLYDMIGERREALQLWAGLLGEALDG